MSKNKKSTRPTAAAGTTRSSEFQPDYTTTKRELKRIGIIAGSILVILVILAIFQQPILSLFMK